MITITISSLTPDSKDWSPIAYEPVLDAKTNRLDEHGTMNSAVEELVNYITKNPADKVSFTAFAGDHSDIQHIMNIRPVLQTICDKINNHFSKDMTLLASDNLMRVSILDSSRILFKDPVNAFNTALDTITRLCSSSKK